MRGQTWDLDRSVGNLTSQRMRSEASTWLRWRVFFSLISSLRMLTFFLSGISTVKTCAESSFRACKLPNRELNLFGFVMTAIPVYLPRYNPSPQPSFWMHPFVGLHEGPRYRYLYDLSVRCRFLSTRSWAHPSHLGFVMTTTPSDAAVDVHEFLWTWQGKPLC